MPAVRSVRGAFPKVHFEGRMLSIQPRIRLLRSFDEAAHVYLGYALRVRGRIGQEAREFTVGIGKAALGKHELQAGAAVRGECVPVADPHEHQCPTRSARPPGTVFLPRSRSIESVAIGAWTRGRTTPGV